MSANPARAVMCKCGSCIEDVLVSAQFSKPSKTRRMDFLGTDQDVAAGSKRGESWWRGRTEEGSAVACAVLAELDKRFTYSVRGGNFVRQAAATYASGGRISFDFENCLERGERREMFSCPRGLCLILCYSIPKGIDENPRVHRRFKVGRVVLQYVGEAWARAFGFRAAGWNARSESRGGLWVNGWVNCIHVMNASMSWNMWRKYQVNLDQLR